MVSVYFLRKYQHQVLSTLLKLLCICFKFYCPPSAETQFLFLAGIKEYWLFWMPGTDHLKPWPARACLIQFCLDFLASVNS